MKFNLSSSDLLSKLLVAAKVIESKLAIRALQDIVLEAQGSQLTIIASNLEITLRQKMHITTDTNEHVKIGIDPKRFLSLMKGFAKQPITISIENCLLTIKTQNGVYKIAGNEVIEYPMLNTIEGNEYYIASNVLSKAINKTLFATSVDPLRPLMQGLFIKMQDNNIETVATDAHKLVVYKNSDRATTPTFESGAVSIVVPPKCATLLKSLMPKETTDICLSFNDNKSSVCFKYCDIEIVAKLTEGNYPNYCSIIPQDSNQAMLFDRKTLISALKRVATCANETTNLIKLKVSNNEMQVSSADYDFSVSAEERNSCEYSDEEFEVGLKSTFLLEILNSFEGDDLVLYYTNVQKPIKIKPVTQDPTEETIAILMTMRLE